MDADSTAHDHQQLIVVDQDKIPVFVKSRHWKAQTVYLNDICLTIALKFNKNCDELESIKEDLYSLLMSIGQTALEHDLLRPVAGVISENDLSDRLKVEIKKWGSDQDWHRGAFTLFIEKNDTKANERIADLLELKIEIYEPDPGDPKHTNAETGYTFKTFSGQPDKKFKKIWPSLIKMESSLNILTTTLVNYSDDHEDLFNKWVDEVKSTADRISRGEYDV